MVGVEAATKSRELLALDLFVWGVTASSSEAASGIVMMEVNTRKW